MARTAKPTLQKLKETILFELSQEDQSELGTWFEAVLEVREADREVSRRRDATKTQEK